MGYRRGVALAVVAGPTSGPSRPGRSRASSGTRQGGVLPGVTVNVTGDGLVGADPYER